MKIQIKDKEYNFKIGFKALLMYERESGKSAAKLEDDMTMGTMVDLFYCGLVTQGEKVTKDFVIEAIDEDMGLLDTISRGMSTEVGSVGAIADEAGK